jgi:hypothetical protein
MSVILKDNRALWTRRLFTLFGIVLLWFIWKADVFWNYYQFKQLCAAEGGLKVYEKLEKGKGWEVQSLGDSLSKIYSHTIPNASFFRAKKGIGFPPSDVPIGNLVDIRYLGGPTLPMSSYDVKAADLTVPITYRIVSDVQRENNNRVSRFWFEVRETQAEKPRLRYTQFRFHWRSIPVWHWFGPSGTTGCPIPEGIGKGNEDIDLINATAFRS